MNAEHGYAILYGPCFVCGQLFTSDPDLVPSVPIDHATNLPADIGEHADDAEYVREPICRHCVDRANVNRRANGLPEIDVLPGAYLDEG